MKYLNQALLPPPRLHPVASILLLILLLVLAPAHYVLAEFEKPQTLQANSILPAKLLKGKHFELNEKVYNDGILNHYTVKSSFGFFEVTTTSSLVILVQEIEALAAMKEVQTDDTAIKSLKKSGENTVTGLKNLFTEPEQTFENAASGVRGLFNRAKETVGQRKTTSAEDTRLEQLIGLSKSKGQIATQYGVSMYSRNQILQFELDRLARADYLGGLGVGIATSFVPGVGGLILSTSGTARLLNEAINSTPASELWRQNKTSLIDMEINEDIVKLFLNNPAYSPALQTIIVASLKSMNELNNRDLFLTVALQASDPVMAKIITETIILTAGYHKNIAPLQKVTPMARLTHAQKKDGTIVVLLPTDYIIWSKKVASITEHLTQERRDSKSGPPQIWTTGDFSALTESKLKSMGWQIHTKTKNRLLPAEN